MMRCHLEGILTRQGKTRYWLVKHADTTYAVVNKLCDGTAVHVNLPVMEKICRVLGCTPSDLFEIVGDDTAQGDAP